MCGVPAPAHHQALRMSSPTWPQTRHVHVLVHVVATCEQRQPVLQCTCSLLLSITSMGHRPQAAGLRCTPAVLAGLAVLAARSHNATKLPADIQDAEDVLKSVVTK